MLKLILNILLLYSSSVHSFYSPITRRLDRHNGLCLKSEAELIKTTTERTEAEPIKTSSSCTATERTVTILERGPNHIVVLKPPSVVCHHSGWAGSRSRQKRGEEPEIPMLQRVRDALHDIDIKKAAGEEIPIRKVNLVHRLDRGASGALLLSFAEDEDTPKDNSGQKSCTTELIHALASKEATKTYVALVRGEGILNGEDFKQKGWFNVTRDIKDEKGEAKPATTFLRFVAGQPETVNEHGEERPRMSIVLARPQSGRWHQIRKHLNGISHPILGDSTHGASQVNRAWKEKRNMPGERTCLHMARMKLPPTNAVPEGIDVSCPLLDDMLNMLKVYAPEMLEEARPILEEEGIIIEPNKEYEIGEYQIPDELLEEINNTNKKKKKDDNNVEIIDQGENYVVVRKPPSVVVHHSGWTGKRTDTKRRRKEARPMLQRVRDKVGMRVNPVHRLDRGASGALLFSIAQNDPDENGEDTACAVTRTLIESMKSEDATKTYIALCDGDGTWNGKNYLDKGWFTVDLNIKDEWGNIVENCSTDLCFVASETFPTMDEDDSSEGRKATVVLARPRSGAWHQIRQHLASGTIGHAIIGDSSHGRSRTNRIWKKKRRLQKERTCLHLAHLKIPPSEYCPKGIDVSCGLSQDMLDMFMLMPELLEKTRDALAKEGITL